MANWGLEVRRLEGRGGSILGKGGWSGEEAAGW